MGSYNEPTNWWQEETPSYSPPPEPQGSVTVESAPITNYGGGGGQDINQIYEQYLGRGVDPSGAATYAGWAPQDIINAITSSQEYANRGYEGALPQGPSGMVQPAGGADVNALYHQYLGRDVDPSGLASWSGKSADEIIAGITGSQEYANMGGHPAGGYSSPSGALTQQAYADMTPEQVVNDIYKKVLGREADAGASGWIEDIKGGTSALELAQRLQASDEGKAYLAAHPEEAFNAMAGISQQNAPFQKEGGQYGIVEQQYDSAGNPTGSRGFSPVNTDFSKFKYVGSGQTPLGGEGASTATVHQYEDNKGGTITVDDRGNMISYTPSTTWYLEQQAKHPDAIRQGYKGLNYLAIGPLDETIKIQGQEIPVNRQEYVTNEKGQLVVDKSGNLIPMIYDPNTGGSGFENVVNKLVDVGLVVGGGLAGGPLGAAAGATFVGLKNESPTNQILRNAALAAATTYLGGELAGPEVSGAGELAGPTYAELGYTAPTSAVASNVASSAVNPAVSSAVTPALTSASSTTPAWLLAAQKGAIVGGTMGGINALASGQDVLKGVGYGALTGGIGGGAGSYFGSQISPFAGNVLGGALAGTAGAAVTGQDILRGAMYGGGSGALNYGLTQSDIAPDFLRNNPWARGAISGAAFTQLAGGDPLRGAASGALGSYFGNQVNTFANDLYNRNFNQPLPDRYPVIDNEWNGPDAKMYPVKADIGSPIDIRLADNAPISTEQMRGVDTNAPLARMASYTPANDIPIPDIEDIFPVTEGEWNPENAGGVPGYDVPLKVNWTDQSIVPNPDGSVSVVDGSGNVTGTYTGKDAEELRTGVIMHNANNPMVDLSQGDVVIPDSGSQLDRTQQSTFQIPNWDVTRATERGYEFPSLENPAMSVGNEGANAREPFMTNVVDKEGRVTIEMASPEFTANTPALAQPQEMPSITDEDLAIMASEMSAPTNTQEAIAVSESPLVEANATPDEQAVIDTLKDIITSPETTAEEKQQAAEELKQISSAIANKGAETGSEQGALSGVKGGEEGGSDKGVIGGVKGGEDNGVLGGVIGGRGLQPGTGGGYWGEEPNPGEDKVDMEDEETPEEEAPVEEVPIEEVPVEEFPEEDEGGSKSTKPNLPRKPLPIKKPIYGSGIPGYSWNENITGALPHNLTATMLAGAPTQEGRRMLQQLRQLYPQLSTIDPHLLQTLSSRAGSTGGAGGGGGALPSPGYPEQASAKTSFAQSNLPASFNALNASGLQGLGGASNPNIAGFAQGGDVHIPEFKTGTTGHYVQGRGDGQSDEIPAMLANGEYVFDADTVAALGNGSNEAGAKALDKMREAIRKHKRSAPAHKIPPKAKSPLEYLKGK